MTAFPGAEASFTGFTSGHTLLADAHGSQHNLEQSEIVATQHKIGTGASTPASNLVLRGTDVGTSAWGQVILTSDVTGVLPQANGGTGTALSTGSGAAAYQTSPSFNSPSFVNATGSLNTPAIANFSNANHNHTNSAGGGTLTFGNTAFIAGQGLSYRLDLQTKTTAGDVIPNAYTTYLTSTPTTLNKEVEIEFGINVRDGASGGNRTGHVRVQYDGVTLIDIIWATNVTSGAANNHMVFSHTPSAGAHTYILQVEADTSSASLLDQAYLRINQII